MENSKGHDPEEKREIQWEGLKLSWVDIGVES